MPGPRSEAGGGGSQVEVKAGRERFLTSRAAVDSAPGRRLGAVVSDGKQDWPWFLSREPTSRAWRRLPGAGYRHYEAELRRQRWPQSPAPCCAAAPTARGLVPSWAAP